MARLLRREERVETQLDGGRADEVDEAEVCGACDGSTDSLVYVTVVDVAWCGRA